MTDNKTKLIRALNDRFRQTGIGGDIYMTSGVSGLEPVTIARITESIKLYDNFDQNNDPYGEHDFGSVKVDGHKLFWKINYYDQSLKLGSDDSSNSDITRRVLTIMLREEY